MKPKARIDRLLTLVIPIPLWAAILVVTLIILLAYFLAPNARNQLQFVALTLGASSAIYSAYYVGATLRLGIERDRKNKSFEILNGLNRPEFVEVRSFIEKELKAHGDMAPKELYSKIIDNTPLMNAVTVVLGIFEDTSVAIQSDYVDEDIIHQSLSFMVPWNYNALRPFIEHTRAIKGNECLYRDLETLVHSWTSGKRLSDGNPFPR